MKLLISLLVSLFLTGCAGFNLKDVNYNDKIKIGELKVNDQTKKEKSND